MSDSENIKRFPGETDDANPELFTTIPANQPNKWKKGQLSQLQLQQYFNDGFVIVNEFFMPKELEPVNADVEKLVEMVAQRLYKAGKISRLYEDENISNRLILIEKEFPGAAILVHKQGVLPKTFQALWSDERLLNVAEQILGTSDIQGHPVWNIRSKVPNANMGVVPWHQDVSYLDKDSYSVMQLAAWIPLVNATKENGCMEMLPGGHRTGRIARHTCCWADTWFNQLDPKVVHDTLGVDVKNKVLCDVPVGSVVFFNNLIPHRSLPNESDHIRWSLDLRWQRADKPAGFFGLKHGVTMRSSVEPNLTIKWEDFNSWPDEAKDYSKEEDKDFDTTNAGPWMLSWEMTHTNRHTAALSRSQVNSAA